MVKPAEIKQDIHGSGYYEPSGFAVHLEQFGRIDQLAVPVPVEGEKIPANDEPDEQFEFSPAWSAW